MSFSSARCPLTTLGTSFWFHFQKLNILLPYTKTVNLSALETLKVSVITL